jgi:hypothetical protein
LSKTEEVVEEAAMVTEPAYKSRKTGEQKPGSITKSD